MFEKIKDKMSEDIEKIGAKTVWSDADLDRLQKMTDTVKNIHKICMLQEGEYETGGSMASHRGYAMRSSMDGNSMRGRDSMGRFTREGSYRGMSRGYSYNDDQMMEELSSLMDRAKTEQEREAIRACLEEIGSGR